MTIRTLSVGHSPDPDDAFMFYALAHNKIPTGNLAFAHELQDIETLNRRCLKQELDISAISLHAFAYLSDKYALLSSGCSMGDRYGPMVVAKKAYTIEELKNLRIAVPGTLTTAFLSLSLLLGRWYEKTGLPLPLGGNVVRKDLGADIISEASRLIRESIHYGLNHRKEALAYALQYGRDLDTGLADKFVGMYVNDWTVDYGEKGRKAVQLLLTEGHKAGVIPHPVLVEFV